MRLPHPSTFAQDPARPKLPPTKVGDVAAAAAVLQTARLGACIGGDDDSMSKQSKISGAIVALATLGGCGLLIAASVVVGLGLAGSAFFRGTPAADDERMVRDTLALPESARLVTLSADPTTPGTFGREGLRVVAVFELSAVDFRAYRASRAHAPGWSPLPVPEAVFDFAYPPIELPRSPMRGLAFCQTGVYATGTTFTPNPCAPAPARFDQYRSAVLDDAERRLTAVFKNYY